MLNLRRSFCLLFLLTGLLINCSSAQNRIVPTPMTPVESLPSAKVNTETKRFESTGGKFAIGITEAPLEVRDLGTETANKKGIDVGKMFIWKFEKTLYTILYKKPLSADGNSLQPDGDPKSQNLRDFEAYNVGMRRGIAQSNSKLISEKRISLNEYPGTEFRYVAPDGTKFIGRMYSVNSVGYQVVGGYADDKAENEVLEVLDSFRLLPD